MTSLLRRLYGIALLTAACSAPPPPPPPVVLGAPVADLHVPLAEITEIAPLAGDRWALASPRDGQVLIVDFPKSRLDKLAPSPFTNIYAIFSLRDTLFVDDWALRKVGAFSGEGKFLGTLPIPANTRGHLPRARDGAGQFFVEIRRPPGPDGAGNRDSAAVVRFVPGSETLDTIVRLSPLDMAEVEGDRGRRFERRVFSGEDRWGVLPDGSRWVARVYQNRVRWLFPDGKVLDGTMLPDRVLEVLPYDRELFYRSFPPELRASAEKLPVSPIKPPFENAFTGADGTVWLERPRAPIDSARGYYQVGRDGALVREVRLPGRGRILAASEDAAIAVIVAGGDSGLRVRRYVLPPITRTTP